MSVEQSILFRKDPLSFFRGKAFPDFTVVQRAITNLGHDLSLDWANLQKHTGYLPAKLEGAATGFEVYVDRLANIVGLPKELNPSWTHACTTRTGGDMREGLAATIFLRAFVECVRGGYWYADDQIFYPPGNAATYLDGAIADFWKLLPGRKK